MKKLFLLMVTLLVVHSTVVAWWGGKKKDPSLQAPATGLSADDIKSINESINMREEAKRQQVELNRLRAENADLRIRLQEPQQGVTSRAQQEELHRVRQENTKLKNENQRIKQEIRDLKQDGTQALKEAIEEAKTALYTAYNTFNTNLPSFHFDKALAEYKDKLPSAKAVRALNNEMANTLYSMKFMYFEARYHLDWMGRQLAGKGIEVPNIHQAFSEEEIKNNVKRVRVTVEK